MYSVEKQVRLMKSQFDCPTYSSPHVTINNTNPAMTK